MRDPSTGDPVTAVNRAGGGAGRAWRLARRRAAREHHPDLGGRPEAYLRALEQIDRQFLGTPDPPVADVQARGSTIARRYRAYRRRARQARRGVRARLPRWVPGRRYTQL